MLNKACPIICNLEKGRISRVPWTKVLNHRYTPKIFYGLFQDEENEPENDSPTFSDWGESFTNEVTRIEEDENSHTISKHQHFSQEHRSESYTSSETSVCSSLTAKFIDDGKSSTSDKKQKAGPSSMVSNDQASVQPNSSHLINNEIPRSTLNEAGNAIGATYGLCEDTFDYAANISSDESFSFAFGQANSNESSERPKDDSTSFFFTNPTFDWDQPTQLYRQQSSESENDHDESFLSTDMWNTPPLSAGDNHDALNQTPTTPPCSSEEIVATPKREVTSPVRGEGTPTKQQKLASVVEKTAKITPVRNVFENLSTK